MGRKKGREKGEDRLVSIHLQGYPRRVDNLHVNNTVYFFFVKEQMRSCVYIYIHICMSTEKVMEL